MGEARTQRASRVFVFRVNRCKTLDILKMFGMSAIGLVIKANPDCLWLFRLCCLVISAIPFAL